MGYSLISISIVAIRPSVPRRPEALRAPVTEHPSLAWVVSSSFRLFWPETLQAAGSIAEIIDGWRPLLGSPEQGSALIGLEQRREALRRRVMLPLSQSRSHIFRLESRRERLISVDPGQHQLADVREQQWHEHAGLPGPVWDSFSDLAYMDRSAGNCGGATAV